MTKKEYYDALLYAEAYLDNAFAGNATDIAEDDDNDSNEDKRRETIEVLKKKIKLANIMDKEA
jgi:hypothetical protein